MYYYKKTDEIGVVTGLLTCDVHLNESETQVEITQEEYETLLAQMPEPEPSEPEEQPVNKVQELEQRMTELEDAVIELAELIGGGA